MILLNFGRWLMLSLLLINSIFVSAQDKDILNWSDAKLSWSDYQGKAKEDANSVLSYIDYTYGADIQGNGKLLNAHVTCFFNRAKSFVGDSIQTPELLQQEQLSFDITEKYARLFRKELQDRKWQSKTFQKEFDQIYKRLMQEHKVEQKLCDRETKRGKNAEKTDEWKNKIAKELKKLDKYGASSFTLKLKS